MGPVASHHLKVSGRIPGGLRVAGFHGIEHTDAQSQIPRQGTERPPRVGRGGRHLRHIHQKHALQPVALGALPRHRPGEQGDR
ncbi:MAG: hypothetical protein ACK55Z_19835, partial [bacterium]